MTTRDGAPRLVASDLDGTLLDDDGSVSAHTAQVWAQLDALGIESVIVTARPPRWLHHLLDVVGVGGADEQTHSVAICGNGAFVYDAAGRRVLEAHGFTAAEAAALVTSIQRDFPDAAAAVETDQGMFHTPAFLGPDGPLAPVERPDPVACVAACDLHDLPGDVVVGKILLRDAAWRDDGFVAEVAACLGERGVLAYSGAAGLAEISAPGVTKAARLAAWCAEHGVNARDVWAFGDMPNDIPMLTWAGRGVAVANAHDDVLAIADDVCEANFRDGVARYLASKLF